jgi:hypothetical protein
MIPKMFISAPAEAADLRGYLVDDDETDSAVLVPARGHRLRLPASDNQSAKYEANEPRTNNL